MEEAFSLSGMAEVPVLAVLGSRPGPSTGVPTYTEQGDLRFAITRGMENFLGWWLPLQHGRSFLPCR